MIRKKELEVESELMWSQIKLKGRHSLLIGTTYTPRHDDKDFVTQLEHSFEKISDKAKGYYYSTIRRFQSTQY